jgi:uncharacterized membrane protein YhaH (DUF805 family)
MSSPSGSASMDWHYLLTSFDGRITRQPFWIASLAILIVETAAHALAMQIQGERLGAIVDLAFVYPQLAVSAKRGFDRNIPLWVNALFYAIAVFINLLLLLGLVDLEDPSPMLTVILVPWGVFALILLVELGFRRGTVGPNRFGPDPLEPTAAGPR